MYLVAYHVSQGTIYTVFSDGQRQVIATGNATRMERKGKFLANSQGVPCKIVRG